MRKFGDALTVMLSKVLAKFGLVSRGKTFYVHYTVGQNGSYDGLTPDQPFKTLDWAVGKCEANKGYNIVLLEGHNEGSDAVLADLDVAGITVIGQGTGSERPTFDYDNAASTMDVGANDVTIKNVVFRPSTASVLIGLDIETGITGTVVKNCEFSVGETADGTEEFLKAIHLTSGNHDTQIVDTKILAHASANAPPSHAIHVDAASNRLTFKNVVIDGPWGTAGILEDAAGTEHILEDCSVDTSGINYGFHASSTFSKRAHNYDGGVAEEGGGESLVPQTRGEVFYVHSGSGSASDSGLSPTSALTTIALALAKCTADQGDTIYVLEGHNEGFGAAQLTLNKAGVAIIGVGDGGELPIIDFDDAAASIDITANNMTLKNLKFRPSTPDVLIGVEIATNVTGTTIENCEFSMGEAGTGADEFAKAIRLVSGNHETVIRDTRILAHASAGGATHGIEIAAASNRLVLDGIVIDGPYATNGILESAAGVNQTLVNCSIDTSGTNYGMNGSSTYAERHGNLDAGEPLDSPANLIGYDDNNNDVTTDNVAANQDGSVLERLEQLQEAVNNGTGLSIGTNKSIVDLLGTTGTAATVAAGASATSVFGAIGTNEIDATTPFTSAAVQANEDGNVLERLEQIQEAVNIGAGTSLGAAKSLVDALGTNGLAVSGATNATAVSILGTIGTNEIDSTTPFTSAAVQASATGTVLEREAYIQAETNKISSVTLQDAPTAGSLATFIASGGTGLGTPLADSHSLLDALGTDGATVTDDAASVLGAIGANNANNAFASDTVAANANGSVLERLEDAKNLVQRTTGATTYFVNPSMAGDTLDGLSWATAKKTMAAAIALCAGGETIYFTGTVAEAVMTIAVDGLRIVGAGTLPYANTWMEAAVDQAYLLNITGDNTMLENIRFRGCSKTTSPSGYTTGVCLKLADAQNTTILGCRFQGRSNATAAIYSDGTSDGCVLRDCEFIYFNTATYGAAILGHTYSGGVSHQDWLVENCRFHSNVVDIDSRSRTCTFKNNTFKGGGVAAAGTLDLTTTTMLDLAGTDTGYNTVFGNLFGGAAYNTDVSPYLIPGGTGDSWVGNYNAEVAEAEVDASGLTVAEPAAD